MINIKTKMVIDKGNNIPRKGSVQGKGLTFGKKPRTIILNACHCEPQALFLRRGNLLFYGIAQLKYFQ